MYNDVIYGLFIGSLILCASSLMMAMLAGMQMTRGARRTFTVSVLMALVGSLMLIATKMPFF